MKRTLLISSLIVALAALAACAPVEPPSTPTPTLGLPKATATSTKPAPTATKPAELPTAAPTPTAAAVPKRGGDFKEVVAADAVSFHPYQTTDAVSGDFQSRVYASGLWMRDPKTLQPIPNMAESWTIDGKTYTFKLRKDLKWSDGTPLTAHDFQWTFEQASKPENRYPYVEALWDVLSYKATDAYTLEIVLKEETCNGLAAADAITPLPRLVWSKLDWNDPTKNPEINSPSVVSGPYKLKEWKRDDHATFVRNDLFFRGAPNFDSVTVRIVPNLAVQVQLLKTGEVDAAPVGIADYAEAKKLSSLKLYEWEPAIASWDYVGLNLRRAFLKDVEVRHALSYATPRQLISEKVFQGLAKPAYSAYPPISWVYNPDVPRYDYNIDTAKATLAKAGYKLDANGKLLNKEGKPVSKLKILYNTGNKQREQIATMLQEEFKKLGIESEVTSMEFQAYLDYLKREPYDYDLYILGWRTTFDPYFSYQIWSESNIPLLNSGAYVNPEVEKLYEQSNRPPCDVESRKKVFGQIQQSLSADSPYIFLTYRTGYQFLNQRVVPNDPSVLGINYFPEQWYVTVK